MPRPHHLKVRIDHSGLNSIYFCAECDRLIAMTSYDSCAEHLWFTAPNTKKCNTCGLTFCANCAMAKTCRPS